ncbi:MAG: hypothetical protein ABSB36_03380 [Candidatus Dormibacteria bacterium]
MKFGRRQSPESEPVSVPPPSYSPPSGGASIFGYSPNAPVDDPPSVPPAAADAMAPGFVPAADAMPPGFPPAAADAMPPGFPPGFAPAAMPPGFPPAAADAMPSGFPQAAADAMPPGFPPAFGGGVPGGFPPGFSGGMPGGVSDAFGGMPGGFAGGFGGGMPGGLPGADGLAQLTAATQNPQVLDGLVRSGKFRTREEAQAWLSQMLARANQSAAQRGAMGGMQPGWGTGQPLPGAGQQTFQDLMDQSQKNRDKGRGN